VTAMVPAAILVLFGATLLAKNVYQTGFNPNASEEKVMRLSRLMVLFITSLALIFALFFPNELVNLLIFGYDGVCQFFPGVVFGLFWERVSKTGVFAGLVAGIGIVVGLIITQNDPFLGLNVGFVGLLVNVVITYLVSLKTQPIKIKGW